MVRQRLLDDIFGDFENVERVYRADTLDEYSELMMLAQAWERNSIKPGLAEGTAECVADADGRESARR